jgi:hypothetical protein
MASPQAVANMLMGGGSLNKTGKKTIICKAFKRAAKRWCTGQGKGNRTFNDFFYQELRRPPPLGDPTLARELTREAGALFQGSKFLGFTADLATGSSAAAPVAQAMENAVDTTLQGLGYPAGTAATGWLAKAGKAGVDSIRWAQNLAKMGTAGGGAFASRFMDGRFADGTILELKGPGDNFKDPTEAVDQIKAGGGKKPAVASCKSCGASACQNEGKQNGMKVWRCS